MRKVNKSIEEIPKIQVHVGNLDDVVNKAMLFNSNLTKVGLVSKAKEAAILLDFAYKMENLLEEMRSLCTRLELEVASLSILL